MRCGIDLVEVRRVERLLEKFGPRFMRRVFTPAEQAYCAGRRRAAPHLAARLAGKEAVAKVLGSGLGSVAWTDIEILNLPSGEPCVQLHGEAGRRLAALGGGKINISLTHTADLAMAVAVLAREAG